MKAMEGNTAEDTFSYMLAEEMTNVALITLGIGSRVQDAYNTRQQCEFWSARRLSECISMMPGATRQDGEHG